MQCLVSTVVTGKFVTWLPNYYYFWKILFWQMPYSNNILQHSLFHHTKNYFFQKIISLKFRHLFFELLFANPAHGLRYTNASRLTYNKNDIRVIGITKLLIIENN
jgi:hypothetical protein